MLRAAARVATVGLFAGALALQAAPPASASTTLAMSPLGLTRAGCQVRGLDAFVTTVGSAGLPQSHYEYLVGAIGPAGEQSPICLSVGVEVTSTNRGVVLRWLPTPDATGYRIYRGTTAANAVALMLSAGVTILPATNAQCPIASPGRRCVFQDSGAPSDPTTPPAAPTVERRSGHHPDLTITHRLDYGGDPTTAADDPFPTDGGLPAALKADVIRLASHLSLNFAAAAICPLTGAAT